MKDPTITKLVKKIKKFEELKSRPDILSALRAAEAGEIRSIDDKRLTTLANFQAEDPNLQPLIEDLYHLVFDRASNIQRILLEP